MHLTNKMLIYLIQSAYKLKRKRQTNRKMNKGYG